MLAIGMATGRSAATRLKDSLLSRAGWHVTAGMGTGRSAATQAGLTRSAADDEARAADAEQHQPDHQRCAPVPPAPHGTVSAQQLLAIERAFANRILCLSMVRVCACVCVCVCVCVCACVCLCVCVS